MITIKDDAQKYNKLFQAATNDLTKVALNNPESISFKPAFDIVTDMDEDTYVNNPGLFFVNIGTEEEPKYKVAEGDFSDKTTYYIAKGIGTLEEFFCHLKDLYTIDSRYIMLPLNEERFSIDANERSIKVPASFKNGVTVQGDVVAETLLFEISRYFDAVDLYDCEIFVQWERAKDPTQYVTPIEDLIHVDNEKSLIIFGWPLSAAVADIAGQIKFSIRFIKRHGDTIVYSLSTTPATISIRQGLDYDIKNCVQDSANDLFDAVITNSENTTGPSAVRPVFRTNLTEGMSYLGEDGIALLEAKADVADGGDIWYEWYYSDEEGKAGDCKATSHPLGEDTASFIVDGVNNENITGYYWVKAINRLNNRQKSVQSNTTNFPGPNEPAFETLCADTVLENGEAALGVTMKPDSHGEHNSVAFQWFKAESLDADAEFKEEPGAISKDFIATAPGKYKVKVTNTVNRQSMSIFSSPACIVYDTPGAIVFMNDIDNTMISGQSYTLKVQLPDNKFAQGEVKYAWYLDYDKNGILVDGVPSTSDAKVEYLGDLDAPAITITSELIGMVITTPGTKLYCVAANTINVGDKSVTTYSESAGYTLTL